LIKEDELFCVSNADDLLKEIDIKNAILQNSIGAGISKKIMPKNYLGVEVENDLVKSFIRHEDNIEKIKDILIVLTQGG
jgi:hypothetical protein